MDTPKIDTPREAKAVLDKMARGNVLAPACASRPVLQHLTSRWGVLVMAVLATGTHRFAQLRREIGGVSERMLAQTLQQLEGDGFVHRKDYGEVPPRVEYSLTPLGMEAAGHLVSLIGWIEGNIGTIVASRPEADEELTPTEGRTARASA